MDECQDDAEKKLYAFSRSVLDNRCRTRYLQMISPSSDVGHCHSRTSEGKKESVRGCPFDSYFGSYNMFCLYIFFLQPVDPPKGEPGVNGTEGQKVCTIFII